MTADRWSTFVVLFVAEALAWAGVPAIGAGGMAAAGALASQGTVHLWSVIVVGTLGAWRGAHAAGGSAAASLAPDSTATKATSRSAAPRRWAPVRSWRSDGGR